MTRAWLAIPFVFAFGRSEATPDSDVVAQAMRDELARTMDKLALRGLGKPYFVSYALWDEQSAHVEASFGALVSSNEHPRRFIDIDMRVGDYAFDNSNFGDDFRRRNNSISIPTENDYGAIRRDLWLATDAAYKDAGETLERKQAVAKEENKGADEAASFTKESPSHIVDDTKLTTPDASKLEPLAKKLSAVFRSSSDVYRASVVIDHLAGHRYFVSSEGAASSANEQLVHVVVTIDTQADDGMPLRDQLSWFADTLDQLPKDAEMIAQVEALSRELSALRKAPVVDDYGGPVLFRGVAASELVRALLAENLSGTPAAKGDRPGARTSGESELVGKVGQRILPANVTVVDDPTIARLGKAPLFGGYRFDEEGIAAQKVSLVENGMLKRFLMSRIPRKGFEHSNGHGRSTQFSPVRAHPSNLVLASSSGLSDRDMLRRALAAAKDQGLGYVIVVDRIGAGDRFSDDSTLPRPAITKRVYADGREELVRGAGFGAVRLQILKDVLAVGAVVTPLHYLSTGIARFDAFGASSGFSVTVAAPPLLVRDLDIKKPLGPQKKPPIAPRPAP